MNPTRLLLFLVTAVIAFPSCNSSKIAYGNSYYFKAQPKQPEQPRQDYQKVAPVSSIQFYASTEETPAAQPKALKKVELNSSPLHQMKSLSDISKLSRAEKKELRQQLRAKRKEIKKVVRAYKKSSPSTELTSTEATGLAEVTGLIKAGIIMGAAGAVMLLIGVLVTNGAFLVTLGGIFLAVGLVLILIRTL